MHDETEVLPPVEVTDIIVAVHEHPEIALLDAGKREQFLIKVREASLIQEPDTSTTKGRDEIRTMASKVTKTKTMLDKSRLQLTSDLRQQVAEINEAGKVVIQQLDALAEEVRQPLTEWEEQEKVRQAGCDEMLAWLRAAAIVTLQDTAATVRDRGREAYNLALTKEQFGKQLAEAEALKEAAVAGLRSALSLLTEQEAAKVELDRLRAEAAERAVAERAAAEARTAEERRLAAERAEAERVERAAQEASERASREAQAAAQREIDEANARAAEAERAAQAERDRAIAEQAERDRRAAEQAARDAVEKAEQDKRERSRKHRAQVTDRAKADIMTAGGVTDDQALAIVRAIIAGKIHSVTLGF